MISKKYGVMIILYSICALLLLTGAVYGATVAEHEKFCDKCGTKL